MRLPISLILHGSSALVDSVMLVVAGPVHIEHPSESTQGIRSLESQCTASNLSDCGINIAIVF